VIDTKTFEQDELNFSAKRYLNLDVTSPLKQMTNTFLSEVTLCVKIVERVVLGNHRVASIFHAIRSNRVDHVPTE